MSGPLGITGSTCPVGPRALTDGAQPRWLRCAYLQHSHLICPLTVCTRPHAHCSFSTSFKCLCHGSLWMRLHACKYSPCSPFEAVPQVGTGLSCATHAQHQLMAHYRGPMCDDGMQVLSSHTMRRRGLQLQPTHPQSMLPARSAPGVHRRSRSRAPASRLPGHGSSMLQQTMALLLG